MNVHYQPTRPRVRQTVMSRLTVHGTNERGYCSLLISVPSDLVEKIGSPERISVSGTIHEGLKIKANKDGIICRKVSANYHLITTGLGNVYLSRGPRKMVEVHCQVKADAILLSGPPLEWVRGDAVWHPNYQPPTDFRVPAKGGIRPIREPEHLPALPVEPERHEPTAAEVFRPKDDAPSPTAPLAKQQISPERDIPRDKPEVDAILTLFAAEMEKLLKLKEGVERMIGARTILTRDLTSLRIDMRHYLERKTGGSP